MKIIPFIRKLLPVLVLLATVRCYGQTQVNSYAAVTSIVTSPCTPSKVYVESSTGFSAGDKVLIIRMRGASVFQSGSNYGQVQWWNNVGVAEYAWVEGVNGNEITLRNTLSYNYGPNYLGYVQMVKVHKVGFMDVSSPITAQAWNGKTGGVVVINACTLRLSSTITVDGKGFRGGLYFSSPHSSSPKLLCSEPMANYIFNSPLSGNKGEGIASTKDWGTSGDGHGAGRGAYANGGGGGNSHNTGGGGGGNANAGGRGGNLYEACLPATSFFGLGGNATGAGLFMGGGGGAGHCNDGNGSAGANGGGIIIIECSDLFVNNGGQLTAKGLSASPGGSDGAGGGGAGGTISIYAKAYSFVTPHNNINISVDGGKGGDAGVPWASVGPGGGGSNGAIFHSSALVGKLSTSTSTNLAGLDSKTGTSWGAAPGGSRVLVSSNLKIKEPDSWRCRQRKTPYDSVYVICEGQSLTICDSLPQYTSSAEWLGFGKLEYFYYSPNRPGWTPPKCIAPVDEPWKIVCKSYHNVTQSGTVMVTFRLDNGCVCTRVYYVQVVKPKVKTVVLNVMCGTSIDLSQYTSLCDSNLTGTGWRDSLTGKSVPSIVTPNATAIYRQEYFTNLGPDACKGCVTRVHVVVQNPYEARTINACPGATVTLHAGNPAFAFAPGVTVDWYIMPSFTAMGISGPTATVIATSGAVYRARINYPNGCHRNVDFTITTLATQNLNRTITVFCGDSLNLDTLDLCGIAGSWSDPNTGWILSGSTVLMNVSRTFVKHTYTTIGSSSCLSCIMTLTVNVITRPPINRTVVGCQGGLVYIEAACTGLSYQWHYPNGSQIPGQNTQGITVSANAGDVWMCISYDLYGCPCTTYVNIITNPIPSFNDTITIYCGDSLDLDSIGRCQGLYYGWVDLDLGMSLLSSSIAPGIGVKNFYRETFADPTGNCINCTETLTVITVPRPIEKIELSGCPGQTVFLTPPCADKAIGYFLYGPNNSIQAFNPPMTSIPVVVSPLLLNYAIEAFLPNGCVCRREFTIRQIVPEVRRRSISAVCGDSLDLDSLDLCDGVTVWKDEAGNTIASKLKIKGETPRKFFGETTGAGGCLNCITEISIEPSSQPPYNKTYSQGCLSDGLMIQPDCEGVEYEWTNRQTGNTVTQTQKLYYVPLSRETQYFSVKTITADGCICITDITVNSLFVEPVFHNFTVNLNCGDIVDLNDYTQCDNAGGTAVWKDFNGQPVSSTIVNATPFNNGRSFYKEVYDVNGCLTCRVTITINVSGNYTYVDRSRYDVCIGSIVNPASNCAGVASYEWYDANGAVLLGTSAGIVAQSGMSGMYLRYNYDANGCLLCIERIQIFAYQEVTPADLAALAPMYVELTCPGPTCIQTPLSPSYDNNFGPGVYCTWYPSNMSDYGNGDVLICAPFTPGTYYRRCYNQDGCLIYAYKIQLNVIPCPEPNPGEAQDEETGEELNNEYIMYPNPTEASFKVERTQNVKTVKVEVLNSLGQLISSKVMLEGENTVEFNLEDKPQGVYIIKITDSTGKVSTMKVMRR